MSGFYGHGHGGNNFSETRPATVSATFDRSPTRSLQNVAKCFFRAVLLVGICLPELFVWLDVLRGVEDLRDFNLGDVPTASTRLLRTSLMTVFALPPSTYDRLREPTVTWILTEPAVK